MITMWHWDIPRWMEDLGGLTNPIFVDYFKAYADVLFEHFGSRVKKKISIKKKINS